MSKPPSPYVASPYIDRLAPAPGAPLALLTCDHGGAEIPDALDDLGLKGPERWDHIAWDPGAADVTRRLAASMGLGAVINRASRLLFDVNRTPDDPTAIRAISEDILIPGNFGVDTATHAARKIAYFDPFHDAVKAAVAALGAMPALIAVHSFTPIFKGARRAVEIGVLWDHDDRIAAPLMRALSQAGFAVGDNQPYSGRDAWGCTIETHATPQGRANVLLEIRNDLIADEKGVAQISDALAAAFSPILAMDALFHPWTSDQSGPTDPKIRP